MILRLLFITFMSVFIINPMSSYDGEGIYQINKLEYSYTNGYGINEDVSYIIDCEDECILLLKEYGKETDDIVKIKLTDKNMDKLENMLNKYHVLSWKGFSKSNKDVLDGNSFSFRLRYNDDEKLSASGYMMYPEYYSEFKTHFENYITSLKK